MSLFVGSIVINVADMARAEKFWSEALHYARRDPDDPDDEEFVILVNPARRGAVEVSLQLWDTPKPDVNRLHLDLYTRDRDGEVRRLEALGATRVAWEYYPPDAGFVVLADPDGNEFCVVRSDITEE